MIVESGKVTIQLFGPSKSLKPLILLNQNSSLFECGRSLLFVAGDWAEQLQGSWTGEHVDRQLVCE